MLRNRILKASGVLLSAVLATWAMFLIAPVPVESPAFGWDATYPVLVQRSALPEQVEQMLLLDEESYVVSRLTSQQEFSVFSGQQKVSVAALAYRLQKEDPRFDPYLANIGNFFRSPSHPDWEVVYLRSNAGSSAVQRHLSHLQQQYPKGILFSSDRTLPVWVKPVIIVLGLLLVGWGISRTRKQRFWVLLAGIPLIITGNAGNPVVFCALAAAFLLWQKVFLQLVASFRHSLHHPEEHMWDAANLRLLIYGLCLLGLNPLGVWLFGGQIVPALVSLLGVLVLLGVSFLAWTWVHMMEERRDHPLFVPVAMQSHKHIRIAIPEVAPFAIVVITGLLFSLFLGGTLGGLPGLQPLQLPQPIDDAPRMSLHELNVSTGELLANSGRLPHLADYVSHRAYQVGLDYGRSYGFPAEGEVIALMGARRQGKAVVADYRQVFAYDEQWNASLFANLDRASIEFIMLEHGEYARYAVGTVETVFFDRGTIIWLMLLVVMAFLTGFSLHKSIFFPGISRYAVAKSRVAA